jgi:hypothetical protein
MSHSSAGQRRKRLVVFVEGKGDEDATQSLLKKLLTLENAWTAWLLTRSRFAWAACML